MKRAILVGILSALSPALLCADGTDSAAHSAARAPVNKASDASFDKRLPPVLPGERMNDSGHEVRVWSSSGPVPVSQAPEPFKDKQLINEVVRNSGIIVDERRDGVRVNGAESGQAGASGQ